MKIGVWKNRQIFVQVIFFGLESLILGLVMLLNFVTASIEWSRLYDSAFWFQYFVNLALGLLSFFITVQGRKITLKGKPLIVGLIDQISAYYNYIAGNDGLYTQMKTWVDKQNREKKLNCYIISLKKQREKLKKREEIDAIDEKISRANEDIEYIDVKYLPKSINLLFEGFNLKDEDELLVYKGNEQMTEYLLPAILIGVIFTAMMMSVVLNFAETTIDTIIQMISRLLCIGSYIWKGSGYADYSINERFKATLENRKAIIQSFFDDIHYSVEIKDNPFYLHTVEKTETKGVE